MMQNAWEKVLELYYGEDPADRRKVTATGFNMDNAFQPDQAIYPFTIDAGVESAGQLVIKLIEDGKSLSDWCFDTISEGTIPGVTFIADDRLFFSNAGDVAVAKDLLGI